MVPAWYNTALQAAPLIEWEPIKVPVYIVASGIFIVFMAKAALYGQQFASKPKSTGGGADDREILVLVRQGHDLQKAQFEAQATHLEELRLLRADLQESQNTSREMISCIRRYQQEAEPVIEKIHQLHDDYFEGKDVG